MKNVTVYVNGMIFLLLGSCQLGTEISDVKKSRFLDSLISEMTLEEKTGQLTIFSSGWSVTGPTLRDGNREDVLEGRCGIIFNALTADYLISLQKMAVEETRLGIPLLFGYDVIHGYKTIFPIPLAESCSWDLELIRESARMSAMEAASSGIHWTFNPMVDICRDPRWGRIAEGSGEDPYLGSLISAAKVRGYQWDSLSSPLTMASCVKHFAAYGAPEAGRDYNIVDLSERTLREIYLPPYQAALDAGAASVMTSFNEINGVPATSNRWLLTGVLREEWGFEGLVITDYTAINELINHGVARDQEHAAELAFEAGVDADMQSAAYYEHLAGSVKKGKTSESDLNRSVLRVLSLKYDLGLFEDPFRYLDPSREEAVVYSEEISRAALKSAKNSIVLLKNDTLNGSALLPLSWDFQRIAVIGPLADNRLDMLGTWHAAGEASRVKNIVEALKDYFPDKTILHEKGYDFTGNDPSGFASALQAARQADVVIMTVGEKHSQSGEAGSRSELSLPGVQPELIKAVHQTGKPVIAVIFAGRPLTIPWIAENIPAVIYAWHLGTYTSDALVAVLSGEHNPSAKLTVTFPRNVGQIPIYYNARNTGRPYVENIRFTSKYLDVPNTPLFPFGYGLSYTEYRYSDLKLDRDSISYDDTLKVNISVQNTGTYAGSEIVQMYIRDMVGSVTRPLKELKGFRKINLEPGETQIVEFQITVKDLMFYDLNMEYRAEPGEFEVMVGKNSQDLIIKPFHLAVE